MPFGLKRVGLVLHTKQEMSDFQNKQWDKIHFSLFLSISSLCDGMIVDLALISVYPQNIYMKLKARDKIQRMYLHKILVLREGTYSFKVIRRKEI
jgi:hypothetical protein